MPETELKTATESKPEVKPEAKPEAEKPAAADPEQDRIEQRARTYGWQPKEEYEGDPDNWMPASEWVKYAPLHESRRKLKKKINELKETVKLTGQHLSRVQEAAYQKALKELESRRDEAIDLGDKQQVKSIDAEIKKVNETLAPAKQAEPEPETVDWIERNPWFRSDRKMATYAIEAFQELVETRPNQSLEDRYKQLDKEMREAFPGKFQNHRRSQPNLVEAPGGSRPRGPSYNDLNDLQKTICDRFVKSGAVKSRQDYVDQLVAIGDLPGKGR